MPGEMPPTAAHAPARLPDVLDVADVMGVVASDAGPDASARAEELTSLVDALQGELDLLRRRDVQIQDHLRRLDDEMRLAARLQQDFLPKSLPSVGDVSCQVLFRPAGYVSGDFYDVPRLDEDHLGLYLLDAVGHGTPAALLTMFMKRALVTKQIGGPEGYRLVGPSEAMRGLNDALVGQDLALSTFATAVYAKVNCRTLEMSLSRAGHPHPVLVRDGEARELVADGGLLGIMPEETFPEAAVQLEPGDRVLIYSDGVECCFTDQAKGDLSHWNGLIADGARLPTAELLATIEQQLDACGGSLEAPDDLTILALDVAA